MKPVNVTGGLRPALLFFILPFVFSACDPAPDKKDDVDIPAKIRSVAFIANEGNFQFGNSSLTVVDFAENKVYADAFSSVNKRPLGDVLQSANMRNGLVYLVVNNSQKIEIINRLDFRSVATFTGFSSPRYIEFLSNTKAYVSEFYSNELKVVNPATRQITGTINCNGWQEEIRLVNGKLYVTVNNRNQVYVIDPATDSVVDSITVSVNPTSLAEDNKKRLWVGCNGNASEKAALFCINTVTDSLEKSFTLNNNLLRRIATNKKRDRIYVLSTDVFMQPVDQYSFSQVAFIPADGHNFYGMGVNLQNDEVYVSDAVDYVQRSMIYRYSAGGTMVGQFKAGLITGAFYFDNE